MRSCISMLMNFVLALTFLQAPFQHVHEHKSTQDHPHSFFHTHFPHHYFSVSKSAELRDFDPDDDAHFQDWFSTTPCDHSFQLFLQTFSFSFAPIKSCESLIVPLILSGRGPPGLLLSVPRGPPV